MLSKRVWFTALVAALAASAAAATIYFRFGRTVEAPIVDAVRGAVSVLVTGPGTVQARVPVTVSARITASVAQMNADVGDAVKRGQVLVLLDDRDLAARRGVVGGQQESMLRNVQAAKASVTRAEADLDLAKSKHRRDAELLRTGFISPAAFDASDASLRAAVAGLDSARAALAARVAEGGSLVHEARYADTFLSFTRIVAPMDGIITQRLAEPGAMVAPGSALLRLVDPSTLWVATRVDESVVGRVQPGQAASIRLRTGETAVGKVVRIARQSDAATREMEVNVAFDQPPARFAIDQEAEVTINTGTNAGIVVPLAALMRDRDGRPGVLAVVDSRAEFRSVQAGTADAANVLILQGLAAGERIVAKADGVKPGTRVHAASSAKP